MERVTHRPWYWLYLKAFVVCYVTFAGLFVVVDAFSCLDEFAKQADGVVEMARVMGRYYVLQQLVYLKSVGPVIAIMAAFFALAEAKRQRVGIKRARP
jgi:lipopolysaccharide export system permease protein